MEDLTKKHCIPCEGGIEPFNEEKIRYYMPILEGWEVLDNKAIQKVYKFKNFRAAVKFINEIAEIAEQEGHHPDINLHSWNKVTLTHSTHAIGGLSENDFILAAKIDNRK